MLDDSAGVILILVLGGLIVPIVLLITAALIDVAVVAWSIGRYGYDGIHRQALRAAASLHHRPSHPVAH